MKRSGLSYYEGVSGELTLVGYDAGSGLRRVVVPSAVDGVPVTRVGKGALSGCETLEAIALPESLTEIDDEAFLDCAALRAVQIPAGVKHIGGRAFEGCESLTLVDLPSGLREISPRLFLNCENLLTARLPSGTLTIGELAFSGCSSLVEASVPAGLRKIGARAFDGCSSLESLTLPASVGEIEATAFFGCEKLDLTQTFLDCRHFGAFTFRELGASEEEGGLICRLRTDEFTVVSYFGNPERLTLPDTILGKPIARFENQAFMQCESLRSIRLPSTTTTLGAESFRGCTALTEIVFPPTMAAIGFSVFEECSALTTLALPAGLTTIPDAALSECSALESVVIPAGVVRVDNYAFYNCGALTAAELPGSVEYVGDGVFMSCEELRSVRLPKEIRHVCANAFDSCLKLDLSEVFAETIHIGAISLAESGASLEDGWIVYRRAYRDVAICGVVGDPSTLDIPSTIEGLPVRSVAPNCFSMCTELTSVSFPDTIFTIARETFLGCSSLESIRFPSTLVDVGARAFAGCSALTTLTFPESLLTIGENAFSECGALTSVEASAETTEIFDCAFANCPALERASFPGLRKIGIHAFSGCVSLRELTVSPELSQVGFLAFNKCSQLDYESTFRNCASYGAASLASSCGGSGDGWILWRREEEFSVVAESVGDAEESLTLPDAFDGLPLREIGDGAFAFHKRLTRLVFPSTLTAVGLESFVECERLRELTFAGSFEIGDRAFWGCSRLERVAQEESADAPGTETEWTGIGEDAFHGCSSLSCVSIPSVTKVGKGAFDGLRSLRELRLNRKTESIGRLAFRGCSELDLTAAFADAEGVRFVPLSELPGSSAVGGTTNGTGIFYAPTGSPDSCEAAIVGCAGEPTTLVVPAELGGLLVTTIGEGAFFECASLETFAAPTTAAEIGPFAFYGCEALVRTKLSPTTRKIGTHAFSMNPGIDMRSVLRGCESYGAVPVRDCGGSAGDGWFLYQRLETPEGRRGIAITDYVGTPLRLALPETIEGAPVTEVGDGAFCGCEELLSASFPPTLRRIGGHAFDECKNLALLRVAPGLETVDYSGFGRCEALVSAIFPPTTRRLGKAVFAMCENLTNVSIPGVLALPQGAFLDDYNLERLELSPELRSVGRLAILKDEALDIRSAFRGLRYFRYSPLPEPDEVGESQGFLTRRVEGGYAVALYLGEARDVRVPDAVEGLPVVAIDETAFADRFFLEKVTLPPTVERIGAFAFMGCPHLTEMNFPDALAAVGDYAFSASPRFASRQLPATVTELGKELFMDDFPGVVDENEPEPEPEHGEEPADAAAATPAADEEAGAPKAEPES